MNAKRMQELSRRAALQVIRGMIDSGELTERDTIADACVALDGGERDTLARVIDRFADAHGVDSMLAAGLP